MDLRVIPLLTGPVDLRGQVSIVIDVIRATTVVATLFEAGCGRVYLSRSPADPDKLRAAVGSATLLCGELGDGSAPPGYDYEPSPITLSGLNLRGRTAVLVTANGTAAAIGTARSGASLVLLGSLRNLSAVAARAAREGIERGASITIIGSGRQRNTRIALEDVYAAGVLAQQIQREVAARQSSIELDDSAYLAARLADTFSEPRDALRESLTGRRFSALGREDDVRFCALRDRTGLVPIISSGTETVPYPVEVLDV